MINSMEMALICGKMEVFIKGSGKKEKCTGMDKLQQNIIKLKDSGLKGSIK